MDRVTVRRGRCLSCEYQVWPSRFWWQIRLLHQERAVAEKPRAEGWRPMLWRQVWGSGDCLRKWKRRGHKVQEIQAMPLIRIGSTHGWVLKRCKSHFCFWVSHVESLLCVGVETSWRLNIAVTVILPSNRAKLMTISNNMHPNHPPPVVLYSWYSYCGLISPSTPLSFPIWHLFSFGEAVALYFTILHHYPWDPCMLHLPTYI